MITGCTIQWKRFWFSFLKRRQAIRLLVLFLWCSRSIFLLCILWFSQERTVAWLRLADCGLSCSVSSLVLCSSLGALSSNKGFGSRFLNENKQFLSLLFSFVFKRCSFSKVKTVPRLWTADYGLFCLVSFLRLCGWLLGAQSNDRDLGFRFLNDEKQCFFVPFSFICDGPFSFAHNSFVLEIKTSRLANPSQYDNLNCEALMP